MSAMRPEDRATPKAWDAARRAAHSRSPRNAEALDYLRQVLALPKPKQKRRSRYERRKFWGYWDPTETGEIPFNEAVR